MLKLANNLISFHSQCLIMQMHLFDVTLSDRKDVLNFVLHTCVITQSSLLQQDVVRVL